MGSQRVRHDWATSLSLSFANKTVTINKTCPSSNILYLYRRPYLEKESLFACVLSRFSHVWLFVTPWTIAHQAALSMGFSRQEYGSGLPCHPPGDLPYLIKAQEIIPDSCLDRKFNNNCSYKKREDRKKHTGAGHVKPEGETGVKLLWANKYLKALEVGRD